MNKTERYRQLLPQIDDWEAFLLKESGLPGRRANLELASVVAELGDVERFSYYLQYGPDRAPVNSPQAFLCFCGVLGLGKLAAAGDLAALEQLKSFASDPRWRIREAVAMALQAVGQADLERLLEVAERWSRGGWLEMRAAAAGIAEPEVLTHATAEQASRALDILDRITVALASAQDRKDEDLRVLRKGLGYCWSVLVAAFPASGKARMEDWFANSDPDVRWVMKENLKKARLTRMDSGWVTHWKAQLRQT
ncbi:MAG: hypothetical protein P8074_18535 [Anaerolineales bacterium]|jgi:hypothetical protein